MSGWAMLLLAASILIDIGGQIAFKLGVQRLEARSVTRPFWQAMPTEPWIVIGVILYAGEFLAWIGVLQNMPLSLAMPFMALSYGGTVAAGRLFLREPVSRRRWAGTALIVAGVALASVGT